MQAKTSHSKNIGDIILDLYEIVDILGEGGFGKVYKVRHKNWNIDLAVKSPKPEIVAAAGGIENFEREAQTWVNLGLHPHKVSCYYVRRIESTPLIFAEYVAGGSLQDWISSRQLYNGGKTASGKRLLDIAIQFAWGLHYAHEQGLIHQDVKPANLMMTPEGVAKVTDFGLANTIAGSKASNPEPEKRTDRTLMVAGSGGMTPAYCSPEQASRKPLTRRSDLWSWGLSVLEMFQGDRTWPVGTIAPAVLESYLEGEKEPDLPVMPTPVADLLRRCFRENPDDRPRTMLEVANQLQEIYADVTGEVYSRQQPKTGQDIADSLNNRAVSLLDLGKQEEALQLWKQALSSAPLHPESTYNQGLILWRSLRINDDTLVRELDEVRKSHPENWLGDYYLGLVHLERDDCAAANASFSRIQAAGNQDVEAALKETQNRLPKSFRLLHNFETDSKRINSVCISRNGKYVLCGKHDGTLELHSLATKECRIFAGHIGEGIKSVCFTSNHCYAVSLSNLTLKLWEMATGECLWSFEIARQVIEDSKSPNNRFELSANPLILTLRETATGEVLHCFGRNGDEVFLTPDSRRVLSIDGQPKLWEIATGEVVQTFDGHTRKVNSICVSPDDRYLLSTSEDTTLKLWEVETGRCLRTFQGHKGAVKSVCISPNGRFALSAGDMTLKVWEIATGRCLRTLAVNDRVNSVCISPNGRFAVSGGNATLKLWAINCSHNLYLASMMLCRVQASETVLSVRQIYEDTLAKAKDAQSQGDAVAAAKYIRKVRSLPGYSRDAEAFKVWTQLYLCLPRKAFSNGWEGATFTGHTGYVNSVILSSDSRYALSGSADNTLKLWDVESGSCLRTFEGYFQGVVNSISMSRDDRFVLSGSREGTLKLWEVAIGKAVQNFEGYAAGANAVCLSPDGRFAVSGNNEGILRLWEATTGRCLRSFKAHSFGVSSVFMSSDGRYLLSGEAEHHSLGKGYEKKLKLWDVATGRCLRTFKGHQLGITSVILSSDNRYALSSSEDKTLKLWDVVTGNCLRTFEGHTEAVTSTVLSSDNRYVLSGSEDKTLKLWDVVTGNCLRTFEGHTSPVKSVILSLDGRFALSGSNDGFVKLWILDWELEDKLPAAWDEGARVYLETFLTSHTPYAATLPDPSLLQAERDRQQQYKSIFAFIISLLAIVWSGTALSLINGRLVFFMAGMAFGSMTGWKSAKFAFFIWLGAWFADQQIISSAPTDSWLQFVIKILLFAGAASAGILAGGVAKGALAIVSAFIPATLTYNQNVSLPVTQVIEYLITQFGQKKTVAIFCLTAALAIGLAIVFTKLPFFTLGILAIGLLFAFTATASYGNGAYLPENALVKVGIVAVAVVALLSSFKVTVLSILGFTPPTSGVCKNIQTAKYYIDQGGDPNALTSEADLISEAGATNTLVPLLECAVQQGKKEVAELLIAKGANVNFKNSRGSTLLHSVALLDDADIANLLIEKGADINAKDKNGNNALHLALTRNKINVATLLVKKGIDANAADSMGRIPLYLALIRDEPDLAKLLISKGANVNYRDSQGLTLLHKSISMGKTVAAEFLIDEGADINAKETRSYTALHLAVEKRNKFAIALLIMKGADARITDNQGYTPRQLASNKGDTEVLEIFTRRGVTQ